MKGSDDDCLIYQEILRNMQLYYITHIVLPDKLLIHNPIVMEGFEGANQHLNVLNITLLRKWKLSATNM